MKENKYTYYVVLQGNYGDGWTDEVFYNTKQEGWRKELREDLKSYRENASGQYRTIRRRELNR